MIRKLFNKITGGGGSVFSGHGLPLKDKFFIALPQVPHGLANVLIHNAYIKYYTDMIGLDPKFVGILYFVFSIWNAVNDPLMGIFIDRFRFRPGKGKYTYLMRITVPIVVLSALAMVFSRPGWNQWMIFFVFLAELFVFDTAHTLFAISFQSYILVAAPSKEERVDVSIFQGYLGHIGGFLGTLIPTMLLVGDNSHTLVMVLFTGVIALNTVIYLVALRQLKDKQEMYAHETENSEASLVREAAGNIWMILKSRAFLTYLIFIFFTSGSIAFYFTPFLYYMDHVLRVNGLLATIADVATGLLIFAFYPLMGILVRNLGGRKTAMIGLVPAVLGFGTLIFAPNYWIATLAYCVGLAGNSAMGVSRTPIMGAIIDLDEQMTGQRKAGLYMGLFALLTIPATGFQAMLFTNLIARFGYDGTAAVQSARAVMGIRLGAGLLPVIFCLIGLVPLILFPITAEKEHELSLWSEQQRGRKNVETDPAAAPD